MSTGPSFYLVLHTNVLHTINTTSSVTLNSIETVSTVSRDTAVNHRTLVIRYMDVISKDIKSLVQDCQNKFSLRNKDNECYGQFVDEHLQNQLTLNKNLGCIPTAKLHI